mgnify:CR=1 FL=1
MSASREKKNRQDLASQGIKDPKVIREAEEKAKQRKTNRLYGGIAVLFVVVAVLLLLVNAGVFYRDPDAITIDGKNYTVAQVNYYYQGMRNSIANAGYYGLDTSKPLDQQNLNDTAKMLLQVTDEGDITWDQFRVTTPSTSCPPMSWPSRRPRLMTTAPTPTLPPRCRTRWTPSRPTSRHRATP